MNWTEQLCCPKKLNNCDVSFYISSINKKLQSFFSLRGCLPHLLVKFTPAYSQVYKNLTHLRMKTLTVACFFFLMDCFDPLDSRGVWLNLLRNGVMTWSGVCVCVWRMTALYISTWFSTWSSFWWYEFPYRPSVI